MQFLSASASCAWMNKHAPEAPCRREGAATIESGNMEHQLGARIYVLLQQSITRCAADPSASLLLLVTETGVWPSNEHLLLYSLVRQRFDSKESVDQSPGHLTPASEREYLAAAAFLCVLYGWGFIVTSEGSDRALIVDHDGNWTLVSPAQKPSVSTRASADAPRPQAAAAPSSRPRPQAQS